MFTLKLYGSNFPFPSLPVSLHLEAQAMLHALGSNLFSSPPPFLWPHPVDTVFSGQNHSVAARNCSSFTLLAG